MLPRRPGSRQPRRRGVGAAELRDALADYHAREHDVGRDAFASALAAALGKPVAEVRAALEGMHDSRERPDRRPHAVPLRELASALGVTRAELRKALREVRAGADERAEQRRADLVTFLANRFNLPESEVEDALPAFRPGMNGGPPPGHHGHGGPGGPPIP